MFSLVKSLGLKIKCRDGFSYLDLQRDLPDCSFIKTKVTNETFSYRKGQAILEPRVIFFPQRRRNGRRF